LQSYKELQALLSSGSRSICQVFKMLDNFDKGSALGTNVASLCITYNEDGFCTCKMRVFFFRFEVVFFVSAPLVPKVNHHDRRHCTLQAPTWLPYVSPTMNTVYVKLAPPADSDT
jgi:hypothetical protein